METAKKLFILFIALSLISVAFLTGCEDTGGDSGGCGGGCCECDGDEDEAQADTATAAPTPATTTTTTQPPADQPPTTP